LLNRKNFYANVGWAGSMSPWPGTSCYKNTDTAGFGRAYRHGMRSGWLVVCWPKKNTFGIMKYDVTTEPSAETEINVGAKLQTQSTICHMRNTESIPKLVAPAL